MFINIYRLTCFRNCWKRENLKYFQFPVLGDIFYILRYKAINARAYLLLSASYLELMMAGNDDDGQLVLFRNQNIAGRLPVS